VIWVPFTRSSPSREASSNRDAIPHCSGPRHNGSTRRVTARWGSRASGEIRLETHAKEIAAPRIRAEDTLGNSGLVSYKHGHSRHETEASLDVDVASEIGAPALAL
jgi:hypothetical protein